MLAPEIDQIPYTDEITAVYEETENSFEIRKHYHNAYQTIFIVEGKVLIDINQRKYEAIPGSIVFINHLESHELTVTHLPYKRYYLLVKPQFFQSVLDDRRLSSVFTHRPEDFSHVLLLPEKERKNATMLFKQLKQELDDNREFRLKGASAFMQLLFISLYRNHKNTYPLADLKDSMNIIHSVQNYIDNHYLEPLSLKSVSEAFFMDMYHVSRLFKKNTGFTFKEYLILQRLSFAKDLLVGSDISVTRVCSESGFNNVNHFIRIFKKKEGVTPYQYRKRYAVAGAENKA